MSVLEATPGPWMVVGQSGFFLVGLGPDPHIARDEWWVAQINQNMKGDDANAYLIAAAPDLYTALDTLQHLTSDIPSLKNNGRYAELRKNALAALAKARGES